ncbi:MAG: FAD-dependent oxidoreductase [Dehalococcoidales bacterium]|nr:FAD-dependent oxidoreductase [Dehalococcoidales bacterium]
MKAEAVDQAQRLSGKGIRANGHGIDWPELMAFKRTFTDDIPPMMEEGFTSQGIDTFHGLAKFTGRNTVQVGDKVLEGRYILIASGAEPMKLGIDGEEYLVTSERFLELENLPGRIVMVGGRLHRL